LYSFDCDYSLVVIGKDLLIGGRERRERIRYYPPTDMKIKKTIAVIWTSIMSNIII
jgi:hypothetical protein